MKISIYHQFQSGPWGGANQFLKALKQELQLENYYTDDINKANVVLFNAHQEAEGILRVKNLFPQKLYAHRMDGIYSLYNHQNDPRQRIALALNNAVADCTVFQNNWAKEEHLNLNLNLNKPYSIIPNASNHKIFNTDYKKTYAEKTRLVCTSWSINKNKGLNYYKFLDENLDFNKYSFTYIGKDPGMKFKNIKKIGPFNSKELASHLKKHDIFISPSKYECCSNSLLEAMSCGLPAVGLNSGGTPEIIGEGGEIFKTNKDLLMKIDKVSSNLDQYTKNIKTSSISLIAAEYIKFLESCIK